MKKNILKMLAVAVLCSVFGVVARAQANVTVSGVVSDASNEPLIGVAVLVQGTTTGTVTDVDGSYSLTVPAKASKLFNEGEITIYTILDERARELCFEERRWPTLLRMGGNGSNEVMKTQLKNNAMYIADFAYFTGTIDWTLFPIPIKYIQMNSEAVMDQNPGWK